MSTIEAKTTAQIEAKHKEKLEKLPTENHKWNPKSPVIVEYINSMLEKWVPFEEAQKLELNLHNAKVLLKVADNEIEKLKGEVVQAKEAISLEFKRFEAALTLGIKLEKQIAEAHKITLKFCEDCDWKNICTADVYECKIKHLLEVLQK